MKTSNARHLYKLGRWAPTTKVDGLRACISCGDFGEALHDFAGDCWCSRCWFKAMRNGVPWQRPDERKRKRRVLG